MALSSRAMPPLAHRGRLFSLVAVTALFLAGAVQAQAPQAIPPVDGRPTEVTVHTTTGDHVFTVEWALTPEQRQIGLMFRTEMAEDHGMVFDFFTEQNVSFWMRNTIIPLDMVFIKDDGTVVNVAEMTTPFSLDGVPAAAPVRYVLEVVGGTADRIGLEPGDTIDLVLP